MTTSTDTIQTRPVATQPGTQAKPTAGASEMVNANVAKAKAFAKARPGATAALVGVVGLALLNTLRGR